MFNQEAFDLLKDTLEDTRGIFLNYFPDWNKNLSPLDCGLRLCLDQSEAMYDILRTVVLGLEPGTILVLHDTFMLDYVLFRSDEAQPDFFSIGPFRSSFLNDSDIIYLQRKNGLNNSEANELRIVLQTIPYHIMQIEPLSIARNILNSFYSCPEPKVAERNLVKENSDMHVSFISNENIDSMIHRIEEIYRHEDRLHRFISDGNYYKALEEAQFFFKSNIRRNIPDSHLAHRSLLYAANTGFRIAARNAGVHPYYLDEISQRYAHRLTLSVSHQQLNNVYLEMVEEYCRVCREFSQPKYSQHTQQIINYILFHFQMDLSPETIAKAIGFSPNYISRKFKQETGISLMQYITEHRIRTARRLLIETQLTVREISSYVGIPDWNYFTKLFKKAEGVTPSKYRRLQQNPPS